MGHVVQHNERDGDTNSAQQKNQTANNEPNKMLSAA